MRSLLTFDAFFENTMFHEVVHGLGIKATRNGKGPVRTALKERRSALEAVTADSLASLFRSVRFVAAMLALTANVAAAQRTVSGTVHDSIAGQPLRGAVVQLVSNDTLAKFGRTALSDSAGHFAFTEVPTGRYMLGFFHPMLDSLGLEPTVRAVQASGDRDTRVDLYIPGAARVRTAVCGAASAQNPTALVMGFVRDAKGNAPVAGAKVSVEWLEYEIGVKGMSRRTPRRVTTTRESGWFAVCGVPSPGTLLVMATRGSDSTDYVEAQVGSNGFLRRDLYLGHARLVVQRDSVIGADTAALPPRRVHYGDGRVSGVVTTTVGGQPLAGAQAGIVNGPQTRANASGVFTILDAPAGTRTLEVRAVGYYPERRTVDVVDGVAPVRVSLVTLKSVLDTIKVVASLDIYNQFRGFESRSRSGMGRFLTAADIARRAPVNASEIFKTVPGVYIQGDAFEPRVVMRGVLEERCEPAYYINGHFMSNMTTNELDAYVKPDRIVGVEVYAAGMVPGQFQSGLTGCGSIVFWTK